MGIGGAYVPLIRGMKMNNLEDSCCKLREFIKKNDSFMNNPLISGFLSKRENYELFKKAVCCPTVKNKENLDRTFKVFYFYVRFTSYVSTTLFYHGINLDKKIREKNIRFPLTLDQPVSTDSDLVYKDLVQYNEDYNVRSDNILDYILDPKLYKAVQALTSNQKEILYLVYVKGYTDTDIAIFTEKSQQTISKSHRKALKKIKRIMVEESE